MRRIAFLKDSDGAELPTERDGNTWSIQILLGDDDEPALMLHVPAFMSCEDGFGGKLGDLDSVGLLVINIREIFDAYISDYTIDNGESLPFLVNQLRYYADRFEVLAKRLERARE